MKKNNPICGDCLLDYKTRVKLKSINEYGLVFWCPKCYGAYAEGDSEIVA